jgi:enterobactin synthetase component D
MDLPVAELASCHGTCVAVAVASEHPAPSPTVTVEEALAALHPDEQASAAAMSANRRRDWVAGRAALRAALHRGGLVPAGPIDSDDRGAPRLPTGAVGSISHKRGLAVALAAAADGWSRGIDVELDAAPRFDIARRVLTPPEAALIAALPEDARGRAIMRTFAIKEAVYKAIDPYLRRYVGFLEVAVNVLDDGTATIESGLPVAVEAAWSRIGGLVVCSARARPR